MSNPWKYVRVPIRTQFIRSASEASENRTAGPTASRSDRNRMLHCWHGNISSASRVITGPGSQPVDAGHVIEEVVDMAKSEGLDVQSIEAADVVRQYEPTSPDEHRSAPTPGR